MGSDIDDALERLACAGPHPGLAGIEERVLSRIAAEPSGMTALGTTLGAAIFALLLGVVSNAIPSSQARAMPVLAPFGAPSALAPSTLLLESR